MHATPPMLQAGMRASSTVALMRQPLLLAAVLAASIAVAGADGGAGNKGLPGCPTSCGNVTVPYPFGIGNGCHLAHPSFNLTCDITTYPGLPRLLLTGNDQSQIMRISLDASTVATLGLGGGNFTYSSPEENPQGIQFLPYQLREWVLVSGVMQVPNETRAGDATCPHDMGTDACHSTHSTCHGFRDDITGKVGYVCRCDDGYQGNPYLGDGCRDIDECMLPGKCLGNCTNIPGNYLCQCHEGTVGDPYTQNGCVKPNRVLGLIIGLGLGCGAMLMLVVLGTTFVIRTTIQVRRSKRMRKKFFTQNRGQLLEQLVSQRADIAESMIITLDELKKATNNFDKARVLGGGGHARVYKGILSSLHVVAIKKSKIVIQKEIDEFINEVVILSQINHRNIVKLLGCCLETEVPLLVYEFISNGTLYNHLHDENLISLTWRDRLRIVVESARSLAYLHSLASVQIIHRDVKSPNILLDDNLTVKLSDFGASRYIPIDQTGLNTTVQGTFGYLDPMYYSTGHLTEKSDVYSFGVLMIELLTRKKPVSYRSLEGHSLVYHFVTLLSQGNLNQILDPQVLREGDGEVVDIALLAAICVKHVSTERPTMRQVEMTLESIYAAKEYVSSDMTDDVWSQELTNVHVTVHTGIDTQSPKELMN